MAVDDDERRSDRKEQKHKHKHRERDREYKDKDRERERGRERESGKDADKHALERGSSHRSDRDRDHKRDRRDRHRDQGEDRRDRHTGTPGDLGRGSPGAEQVVVPRSMSGDDAADVPARPSNTRAELAPESAAIQPQVQESGGEVSMSIEETNRSANCLKTRATAYSRLLSYAARVKIQLSSGQTC